MKKLLIASSVLAALSMGNVAFAGTETANGGTIEFIGEITDTTCLVDVKGTDTGANTVKTRTNNTVLLPVVTVGQLTGASGRTAGRTQFQLAVHSEASHTDACVMGVVANRDPNTGVPIAGTRAVNKVKAIFGGNLTSSSMNQYGSSTAAPVNNPGTAYAGEYLSNINMADGRLLNILTTNLPTSRSFDQTYSATGVELQILDNDFTPIKVGDIASQETGNLFTTPFNTTNSTLLTYYVEYYSTGTAVTAGLVRGYVNYDLMYD